MSEIFVDTIRKTGGSLGTDIRVKNTSVYESDGGTSVTQNLVQGVAKSWCNADGTGTAHIDDSLNTGSLTDGGTGIMTITFTNNMGNTETSRPTGSSSPSSQTIGIRQANNFSASQFYAETYYGTSTQADFASVTFSVFGDLA
jgi:hypothetical protein